jgi:hypothetical protein
MAQVLAREADVPRLLRHVDAHHAPDERMDLAAGTQRVALGVVDRLLAAEDEEEEELGELPAEDGRRVARPSGRASRARARPSRFRISSSRNMSECCVSSITSWYA